MERDFELEYKELKQSETPDLWNRIEAGLSEKKIATVPFEENRNAYLKRFTVKKQTPWKRWGLLAAACLCVVIVLPAMMISLTNSEKSSSSADTASPAEESADGFAGGAEAGADMAETAENTASESEEDNGALEESESAAAAEPEAVSPDSMTLELTGGQILEEAVVQILSADTADEKEIYMATVKEPDADRILTEEMPICIICDADSEYGFPRGTRDETALKTGESYTVTLRYDEEYEQDESVESSENPVFFAVDVNIVEH